MQRDRLIFVCLTAACLAAAQSPDRFAAADVRSSAPHTDQSGGFFPPGRVEFRGATLLRLITVAWSLPRNRVSHAPPWLDTDRFDVLAKAPAAATQSEMRRMLQSLLIDRFHLEFHNVEQPVPAYALEPRPGNKTPAPGSGKPDCTDGEDDTRYIWTCHNTTIAALAAALPDVAPQFFDQPVVDRSGLSGAFDFRLEWMNRYEPQGLSIFSSIEKQLGLKVEKTTEPMQVFAIEHIDRTPVPNPPETTALLGPQPTEFEVADIQLTDPGQKPWRRFRNGRFDYKAVTLRELISLAAKVDEDWVFGGEKWLDADRYDVLAETAPMSFESARTLIAAILRERFHLEFHLEQQPVTVYALESTKAEHKPADPAELSTCNASAGDGARVFDCRNLTMPQFAERLAAQSGIEYPVIDETGLAGSYNFSLAWSPGAQRAARRRRNANLANSATPQASDPLPGLTILQALNRQLGLKLKEVRRPMPVLVIDRIDRTPTAN